MLKHRYLLTSMDATWTRINGRGQRSGILKDFLTCTKQWSFGAGRRVCTGSQLAMLIVTTTVGRLVQEFEWKLADEEEENTDTDSDQVLTSRKLHPLYVIPTPRVA
ncbi:hypothetical protein QQ045_013504 [Rhodiola kirilowii]